MAYAGTLYDKHTVIQKLQKRGFSHKQAEGIAEILTDPDTSSLSTKANLEIALAKQSASLIKWVAGTLVVHGVATAALTVALLQLLA